MNQMTRDFNTDNSIKNIAVVLGYEELEEMPHYDTINNFFEKVRIKGISKNTTLYNKRTFQEEIFEKI